MGEPRLETVQFDVEGKSESATKTVVEIRDFSMTVDEPESIGGSDDGPSPVEYLLGSLAGCLNVVGHMVADEMGVAIDGIEFAAEGDLAPAKLHGRETDARAGYREIRVSLTVDTGADRETMTEWVEAVEKRCPVTDNLRNPTPVEISVSAA